MDPSDKPKTRTDVAELLKSIGKPGEKQAEKLKAIQDLEMKNNQGHGVEATLESYEEY